MRKPNKEHLDKFLQSSRPGKWKGSNQLDWWASVFNHDPTCLESKITEREELKEICANHEYRAIDLFTAVMAWGSMSRKNGRYLKPYIEGVCEVITQLKKGELSRNEAYSNFYRLRCQGKSPGMRPAYYTKLIFFCSRRHDGYIMDQWTAKSINLIYGDIVKMEGGYVSDKNDAAKYEIFCGLVEELSEIGKWSPEETEMRLFCQGGKMNKGDWRKHVEQNFPKK